MGRFSPLLTVDVEHEYFSRGYCRGLEFVPSARTRGAMKNAWLYLRPMTRGIQIFHDEDNFESLGQQAADPAEPLSLEFKVFTTDPLFGGYTELEFPQEDSILFFDTQNATEDGDGRRRLTRDENTSQEDLVPLDSKEHKPFFAVTLDKRDRLSRPLFVLNIRVSDALAGPDDTPGKSGPARYYLNFGGRKTIWKYYFTGDLAREHLHIADQDDEVQFQFVEREVLADDRIAFTFKSERALSLRERSEYRFQLREKKGGNDRLLIHRLPVASVSQLGREAMDAPESLISEIFVSC